METGKVSMPESKRYDPCDPQWKLSQLVRESLHSRFGGDVEAAAKAAHMNPRIIRDVLRLDARLHRGTKLTRLVDAVVNPHSRHEALLARDGVIGMRSGQKAEAPSFVSPGPLEYRNRRRLFE